MIRWLRRSPSFEAKAFDEYLEGITASPTSTGRAASDDLELFATWVQDAAKREPDLALGSDQGLQRLLAAQQSLLESSGQTGKQAGTNPEATGTSSYGYRPAQPLGSPAQVGQIQGRRRVVESEESLKGPRRSSLRPYLAAAVFVSIVSVALVTILFNTDDGQQGAGAPSTATATAEPSPSVANTTPTTNPQPVVVIDGVAMTVSSWELREGISTAFVEELPRRGEFLVLQVTLVNRRSIANQDAPFKALVVVDGANTEYAIDNFASVLANDAVGQPGSFSNIRLESGVENVVYLVFDVPVESSSFQLTDKQRSFLLPIFGP